MDTLNTTARPCGSPLAIEYRPISDLIPYARNARTHDEGQVALIAGSIREFGLPIRCWLMERTASSRGMVV